MSASLSEASETHATIDSTENDAASVDPSLYDANTGESALSSIDKLVFAKLKKLRIAPAKPCSDSVFVRRVYLDLIGTLPEPDEAKSFLDDQTPEKRAVLIEKLLAREEFNDYWANKWSDILRIKAEFPINLWPLAALGYHQWIRDRIAENYPYDRFVHDMLTSSGGNFKVPPVNFYRAVTSKKPEEVAKAAAQTFMGERAEKWPAARLDGLAKFFGQIEYKSTGEWKEEIVCWDPQKEIAWGLSGSKFEAVFPDGQKAAFAQVRDPRQYFADWLISAQNPYFARNICNRIWYWLMGRGIIHEPDDIRPDNPPQNPALLAYLERELVSSSWNLRHIYKIIASSQVYQLASLYDGDHPDEAARNFGRCEIRRLDAEVLLDAINQITGGTETYSSETPEPYTWLPADTRAICIPDGSITSPFLEMFGRPPRDTGLESERVNKSTSQQRLHMLNSTHIQRKIEHGPKLAASLSSNQPMPQIVEDLYLRILSRRPTPQEIEIAQEYAKKEKQKRNWAIDVAWAALNSSEFLYRH